MRVDVGGIGVHVETLGDGPAQVLLVHGLGASRACWDEAPRFFDPALHRLILPDLPGFGESDRPEDHDYSMASMAAALEAVLDACRARDVHVVAHSMGCAPALLLAGSADVRPLSFAAAEGNLVAEDAFMSSKVARLKEATFVRVFSKFVGMVKESLGPEPLRMHEVFVDSLRRCSPVALHRASVACQEMTRSGALAERFSALTCPRMYLVGGRTLEERELPEPVRSGDVEVVEVPGRGHFMMDDAEAFYPPIRRLVDGASG